MKVRYEIKVVALLILGIILIVIGAKSWNNTTVPMVLTGAVCVLASDKVVGKYEV